MAKGGSAFRTDPAVTTFYGGLAGILIGLLIIYPRWSFVASAEPVEIEVYAVDVSEEDDAITCRPRLAHVLPDGRQIRSITSTWTSPCAHVPDDAGKMFPGYLDPETGEMMTEAMLTNYKAMGHTVIAMCGVGSVISVVWLLFSGGVRELKKLNPLL